MNNWKGNLVQCTSQCADSGKGTPMFSRRGKSTIPQYPSFAVKGKAKLANGKLKKQKDSEEPDFDDYGTNEEKLNQVEETLIAKL